MTSAANEAAFKQATYDAVIKKTFTQITERPPTRRSVDTLRREVEHALVYISCPNWGWSDEYGLLAGIKPASEHTTITGGLVYVPVYEDEPELTHPRIRCSNSKYQTKKMHYSVECISCLVVHEEGRTKRSGFQNQRSLPSCLL